jgi:hypothetical protein
MGMHRTPMTAARFNLRFSPLFVLTALIAGALLTAGCSTTSLAAMGLPLQEIAKYSPSPAVVTPYEAIESAQQYVREHPGSDFSIGSGDSMLPLYRDQAVIVTERLAMAQLHLGQTVVFMGRNGVPVAHTLIRHTNQGWITRGLGNPAADDGVLTEAAYMGAVVKAYQPTGSPILAYGKSAPSNSSYAVNQ